MNRGERREAIFSDDWDRECFLETPAEACQKTDWQVHAWCLMRNHFHLVIETPRANLVEGMKWLLDPWYLNFKGTTPSVQPLAFSGVSNATIHYLPGKVGWGSTFAGLPTAVWRPRIETAAPGFGIQNSEFGFNISWASGMTVAVEACEDPASSTWVPIRTNTLTTDTLYFGDADWTHYPNRFYRLRSP